MGVFSVSRTSVEAGDQMHSRAWVKPLGGFNTFLRETRSRSDMSGDAERNPRIWRRQVATGGAPRDHPLTETTRVITKPCSGLTTSWTPSMGKPQARSSSTSGSARAPSGRELP